MLSAAAGALAAPLGAAGAGRQPGGLTGREIVIPARGWTGRLTAVPDYERTIERLVLSVPGEILREPGASGDTGRRVPVSTAFLQEVYGSLLAALPAYTTIDVVAAESDRRRVAQLFAAIAGGRRFTLHALDDPSVEPDLWAQDLGEAFVADGAPRFLVSMPASEEDEYNRRITRSREVVALALFGRDAVTRADFVFEGGNLSVDRAGDGLRVFVGYNDLLMTERAYRALGRRITVRGAAERVSAWLGGAEVVVMGTDTQSPWLPHIDQAFALVGDRTAVVNVLDEGASKERRQLAQFRAQLEALGYRTLAIATRDEDVRNYRTSTNALPFVDRTTSRRTVIFPVFPGEAREGTGGALTGSDLIGKGRAAFAAFGEAGCTPVPIRDFSHVAGGSVHCITNVIA